MAEFVTEQSALLNQIKTQISTKVLTGSIVLEKDNIELIRNKDIPFVNIKLRNFKIGKADNMEMQILQRHNYEISISAAVSHIKREDALLSSTGIWSLYKDIKNGLDTDLSFNHLCSPAPIIPDSQVDAVVHEDGKRWIGRCVITFTLYKDFIMV